MTTKRWMILLVTSMLLSGFTGYTVRAQSEPVTIEGECPQEVTITHEPAQVKIDVVGATDLYREGFKDGYAQGQAHAECPQPQPEVEIKVQPASRNSVSLQRGDEAALAGYTRRLSSRWGIGGSILWDWRDDVTVGVHHPCRDWYCRPVDPASVKRSRTVLLGSVTYWF